MSSSAPSAPSVATPENIAVGEPETAEHDAVTDDVQDDRALLAPRGRGTDFRCVDLLEQAWAAHADAATLDNGGDTDRRGGREARGGGDGESAVLRGSHDGPSEGVFTVGLGGGGEREHGVAVEVTGDFDRGHGGFALGERAGLVE